MTFSPKIDNYSTARGGYSLQLELRCNKCSFCLGTYQKDGPGPLKRLYVDRFITNDKLSPHNVGLILECPNCKKPIALGATYEKEDRPCWTLFAFAIKSQPTAKLAALNCWIKGLLK